jgi:hypothetical protein
MSDLTLENYCHQNKIELFFMPFGEAMLMVARLLKLLIYGITSFLFLMKKPSYAMFKLALTFKVSPLPYWVMAYWFVKISFPILLVATFHQK